MIRATLAMMVLFAGCEGEELPPEELPAAPLPGDPDYERDPSLNVELESEDGAAISHNTGRACMHCHQQHSNGRGLFTAAGSVYHSDGRPAAEGSVQIWAGSALEGELLLELPVDAFGNFYTTADLGLPDIPIQPVVLDAEGQVVNQMPWPTESASCNHCHTPGIRIVIP